jgi:Cu(I)/Ag(I) efflux system periplasmic protein CusF
VNPIPAMLAAALFAAAPAFAQSEHSAHHPDAKVAQADPKADSFADGEVKKVDKGAGKVTIKHGPMAALDMPPMTMVFRVKDPAMLDQVKAGDNIRFKAEKIGGSFTVTELQGAK